MFELKMYLGCEADIARDWVYDDGVVVSVASARDSLEKIRAEFGAPTAWHSSSTNRLTRPSSLWRASRTH